MGQRKHPIKNYTGCWYESSIIITVSGVSGPGAGSSETNVFNGPTLHKCSLPSLEGTTPSGQMVRTPLPSHVQPAEETRLQRESAEERQVPKPQGVQLVLRQRFYSHGMTPTIPPSFLFLTVSHSSLSVFLSLCP